MTTSGRRFAAAVIVTCGCVAVVGCKPRGSSGSNTAVVEDNFDCSKRRAEYIVAGGFAADEAGVTMQCTGNRPALLKWQQDAGAERATRTFELSSERFEDMWERIDSTGWRNIEEECANPEARDTDPIYTIEVADWAVTRTLQCQGRQLPFPYGSLVTELDSLAASLSGG